MRRRKLLVGLGSLAGARVVGSGAFTSVRAQRTVDVQVANDVDALLRLAPCKGSPNGDYVTGASSGAMALDLSSTNTNVLGEGVNPEATTVFDNVLEICNQGAQEVGVWIDVDPIDNGNGNPAVEFYQDGDQSSEIVGQSNAVCLGVGDCVCIGFVTRTQGLDAGTDLLQPVSNGHEMVVHADADASCSSPIPGATPLPGPTGGLLSYWPLDSIGDGTAEDVVGTNDGTPQNGVSAASGQVDDAASFDGSDDYVSLPSIQLDGSLTVAAWVKREAAGSEFQAISSQGDGYATSSTQTRNWWLGGRPNEDRVHWSVFDASGTNHRVDSSPGSFPSGQFAHVAGVYDKNTGTLRVFIDGSLDTDQSVSSFTPETSSDPGAIGAELGEGSPGPTDAGRFFDGVIDDVRVYDRALSAGEVQDLYDATK